MHNNSKTKTNQFLLAW